LAKQKATSGFQILLAIVMMLTMLSGFVFVYAIDIYDNGETTGEIVFESDSNMQHSLLDIEFTPVDFLTLQNAYYYSDSPYFFQYNKTAVYNGNNTWLLNCNGTIALVSNALNVYEIIPNIDSFIIDNIIINMNIDIIDVDVNFDIGFIFDESGTVDLNTPSNERLVPLLDTSESNYGVDFPDGWYNKSFNLPLSKSLNIYDLAQEKTNGHLYIVIGDGNANGLTAFTLSYEVIINGKPITTMSTVNTVKWAIGGTGILGIIVGIFMLDQYDLGGYTKDLPKRKAKSKNKPKKSKGGK
jgi:hypothetical protein